MVNLVKSIKIEEENYTSKNISSMNRDELNMILSFCENDKEFDFIRRYCDGNYQHLVDIIQNK